MKTVVIDGDLNLINAESAELGVFTLISGGKLPAYTGVTTVTPKAFESTVLETAGKSVYEDIEVLEIPYDEVGNASGGYTVSIG